MKFSKKSWKSWFFAKIVKNRKKSWFLRKNRKFSENFVKILWWWWKFSENFVIKKNFYDEKKIFHVKILCWWWKFWFLEWKIGKFCEKSENFLKNRKILNFQKFWKNDEKSRFWGHFGSKKPEKWPFFGFSTFDNFDNFLVVSWTPKSIKIDKNRVFSHFFRDLVFCVFGVKNAPRGWLSEFRGWLSRISD